MPPNTESCVAGLSPGVRLRETTQYRTKNDNLKSEEYNKFCI